MPTFLHLVLLWIIASHAADVDQFLSFTSDWSCNDTIWKDANRATFCLWPGITCSGAAAMTRLGWTYKSCTGTVDLSKLPSTVTDITLEFNNFRGPLALITSAPLQTANFNNNQFVSVDLTNPPSTLVNLHLRNNVITFPCNPFSKLRPPLAQLIVGGGGNRMTCDLDTTTLPNTLTKLDVNGMNLKCCIDFTSLPTASFPLLRVLNIRDNAFTGVVNLAALQSTLTSLDIWNNKFTVLIQNLAALPPNMDNLVIGSNTCTGDLDLSVVHSKLLSFQAESCAISCCLDLAKLNPPSAFAVSNLNVRRNLFTSSLDFAQIPPVLRVLDIYGNKFRGDLNFTNFQNLTSFRAANNNFTGLLDFGIASPTLLDFDVGVNSLGAKCPLDLSNLSPKLTNLNLRYNNINCSVDFTRIRSPALTDLYLNDNYLWGLANFSFPSSLKTIDISDQLGRNKPVRATGFTTLDVSNIPATIKTLWAQFNSISCCLQLEQLPQNGLTNLQLFNNVFNSTLNLTAYPTSLRELLLHNNKFTGLVNLTHPSFSSCNPASTGLNTLRLSNNAFTKIDLSNPSACLQTVEAQVNSITNPLFMTNTKNIQTLWLGNNKFSGTLVLHGLSPNLLNLNLANNKFTNRANWTDLPPKMTDLILSGNLLWRSMNNATLPLTMKNFDISRNQFCGKVTVSWCPAPLPPGIVASSCPLSACPSACNNVNLNGYTIYASGSCQVNNTLMGMAGVVVTNMCVGNTQPTGTCPDYFCPGVCPRTFSESLTREKMSFSRSPSLTETNTESENVESPSQSPTRTHSATNFPDSFTATRSRTNGDDHSHSDGTGTPESDKPPTKTVSAGTTIQFTQPDGPSFEVTLTQPTESLSASVSQTQATQTLESLANTNTPSSDGTSTETKENDMHVSQDLTGEEATRSLTVSRSRSPSLSQSRTPHTPTMTRHTPSMTLSASSEPSRSDSLTPHTPSLTPSQTDDGSLTQFSPTRTKPRTMQEPTIFHMTLSYSYTRSPSRTFSLSRRTPTLSRTSSHEIPKTESLSEWSPTRQRTLIENTKQEASKSRSRSRTRVKLTEAALSYDQASRTFHPSPTHSLTRTRTGRTPSFSITETPSVTFSRSGDTRTLSPTRSVSSSRSHRTPSMSRSQSLTKTFSKTNAADTVEFETPMATKTPSPQITGTGTVSKGTGTRMGTPTSTITRTRKTKTGSDGLLTLTGSKTWYDALRLFIQDETIRSVRNQTRPIVCLRPTRTTPCSIQVSIAPTDGRLFSWNQTAWEVLVSSTNGTWNGFQVTVDGRDVHLSYVGLNFEGEFMFNIPAALFSPKADYDFFLRFSFELAKVLPTVVPPGTTTATGVLGTIAAVTSVGSISQPGRISMLMRLSVCPFPNERDVDIIAHPTQITFGNETRMLQHYGAAVSNTGIVATFWTLHFSTVVTYYFAFARARGDTFKECFAPIRFPSLSLLASLFFYQTQVESTLYMALQTNFLFVLFLGIALFLAWVTLVMGAILRVIVFRFGAKWKQEIRMVTDDEDADVVCRSTAPWYLRLLLMITHSTGKWIDADAEFPGFVHQYALLFEDFRAKRHWFMCVDVGFITAMGCLGAIDPQNKETCIIVCSLVLFSLISYGFTVLFLDPYSNRLSMVLFYVSIFLQSASVLIMLIDLINDKQSSADSAAIPLLITNVALLLMKSIAEGLISFFQLEAKAQELAEKHRLSVEMGRVIVESEMPLMQLDEPLIRLEDGDIVDIALPTTRGRSHAVDIDDNDDTEFKGGLLDLHLDNQSGVRSRRHYIDVDNSWLQSILPIDFDRDTGRRYKRKFLRDDEEGPADGTDEKSGRRYVRNYIDPEIANRDSWQGLEFDPASGRRYRRHFLNDDPEVGEVDRSSGRRYRREYCNDDEKFLYGMEGIETDASTGKRYRKQFMNEQEESILQGLYLDPTTGRYTRRRAEKGQSEDGILGIEIDRATGRRYQKQYIKDNDNALRDYEYDGKSDRYRKRGALREGPPGGMLGIEKDPVSGRRYHRLYKDDDYHNSGLEDYEYDASTGRYNRRGPGADRSGGPGGADGFETDPTSKRQYRRIFLDDDSHDRILLGMEFDDDTGHYRRRPATREKDGEWQSGSSLAPPIDREDGTGRRYRRRFLKDPYYDNDFSKDGLGHMEIDEESRYNARQANQGRFAKKKIVVVEKKEESSDEEDDAVKMAEYQAYLKTMNHDEYERPTLQDRRARKEPPRVPTPAPAPKSGLPMKIGAQPVQAFVAQPIVRSVQRAEPTDDDILSKEPTRKASVGFALPNVSRKPSAAPAVPLLLSTPTLAKKPPMVPPTPQPALDLPQPRAHKAVLAPILTDAKPPLVWDPNLLGSPVTRTAPPASIPKKMPAPPSMIAPQAKAAPPSKQGVKSVPKAAPTDSGSRFSL